ncbi:MAG: hypothetical protein JW787_11250 [Sedimentisphaerales bacterium]|nr:hypothetical protein [Sedimentisphaerales bacterium]
MNNETENNVKDKKPSKRTYIIAAVCFVLLLIGALIVASLNQEPKPDPESEKIIRQAASGQLQKNLNELTEEDLATIEVLYLNGKELCDFKMLEKLTNLQQLRLSALRYPENAIPEWMKILAKLGIFDINKRFALDLSPLKKLQNLQSLTIVSTQIKNYKPLFSLKKLQRLNLSMRSKDDHGMIADLVPIKELINLQSLELSFTNISDLEPIKEFKYLQLLDLYETQVSDLEPIKNLSNLQYLDISGTQVSNIEHLRGLTKLQRMNLIGTPVSDLESLKNLTQLKTLVINNCKNITDQQVEDLQKALPNLKIIR